MGFESRPDAAAFARTYPGATGSRVRELCRRHAPETASSAPHPPDTGTQGRNEKNHHQKDTL